MGCVWFLYGSCMVVYCSCMVRVFRLWFVYGSGMVRVWFVGGSFMVRLCSCMVRGRSCMIRVWFVYALRMVRVLFDDKRDSLVDYVHRGPF